MTDTMAVAPVVAPALDEQVSCFWIYRLRPSWRLLDREARRAGTEALMRVLQPPASRGVTLRGSYSMAGLHPGADFILWLLSRTGDSINDLAVDVRGTGLGQHLEARDVLLGLAGPSEYNPDHLPAFLKGDPPRRYLSVYPFVKAPEWYLLPEAERREMMAEHGRAGRNHPVAGNTVRAFGLGDAEFVVALEAEHLKDLVDCMDALRRFKVRQYTQRDAPTYLGRLQPLEEVLAALA
ncbi:MAG TPA: chlorite dismutase family protein [Candidatus Dormibacteraeota bacterium]|nr:chlorite dismutase family protein [Candidatus Dormibacteraeota bacterium]